MKAHSNIKQGYIYISSGELHNSSINRSPTAYKNNPAEERRLYDYDTDKMMTLLRFVDTSGKDLGKEIYVLFFNLYFLLNKAKVLNIISYCRFFVFSNLLCIYDDQTI